MFLRCSECDSGQAGSLFAVWRLHHAAVFHAYAPRSVLVLHCLFAHPFCCSLLRTAEGFGSLLADRYARHADVLNRGFSGYNTVWAQLALEKMIAVRIRHRSLRACACLESETPVRCCSPVTLESLSL
jgi:hypothetical protein